MQLLAIFVFFSASVLFIVAFLLSKNEKHQGSHKLPPGNLCLPLIGETLSFIKPHSLTTLGTFMQHRISRFGKIFTTNIGGEQIVVSVDAELNKFILRNENTSFIPGLPRAHDIIVGEGSLTLARGDDHRYKRSTVLAFLSSEKVRTIFLQDVNHVALEVISSWKEGTVISAKDEATKFLFYVMAKKMLSITPAEHEVKKLQTEYESIRSGFSSFQLNIPGTTFWKALQSRKNILKIFRQEMEKRKGNTGDKVPEMNKDDFLGWLMMNTHYSEEHIGDLLLGVLFAGHDTTSRAISALIYFLSGCPSAIKQLRDEHLKVANKKQRGDDKLTWDDYKTLEFTKCVIKETLRLGFVVVQKKATEDVKFNGYLIPKDCKVILHIKAMHLDPSIYEDPECFNPWRWLSSTSTMLSNSYMPFGGGARLCPGAELARLEMAVFLYHLILKYDWELAEPDFPMEIPNLEFQNGLPIKVQAV